MTPDDAYALALGTGDRYPALLAAALNGVGEGQDAEPECELVVEEPDYSPLERNRAEFERIGRRQTRDRTTTGNRVRAACNARRAAREEKRLTGTGDRND